MEKFEIGVPFYGKNSALKTEIIEAKDEKDAVNIFVKKNLAGEFLGAQINVLGEINNKLKPYHFHFLDNGHIFFSGIVTINYA